MSTTAYSPDASGRRAGGHARRIIALAYLAATVGDLNLAPDDADDGVAEGPPSGSAGADGGAGWVGFEAEPGSAHAPLAEPHSTSTTSGATDATFAGGVGDSSCGPDVLGLEALGDHGLVELAGQLETLSRRLDAFKVQCAGEISTRTLAGRYREAGAATPVAMLRQVLQLSAAEAAKRLVLATAFLPATDPITLAQAPARQPVLGAAFLSGACSAEAALAASRAVTDAAHLAAGGRITASELEEVEARLAAVAVVESPDFLARCARRILAHLDPDGSEPTEAELLAKEGIHFGHPRRGLVRFEGHLTQLSYEELMAAIGTGTNPRTLAGIVAEAGGAGGVVAVPGQGAPPAWAVGTPDGGGADAGAPNATGGGGAGVAGGGAPGMGGPGLDAPAKGRPDRARAAAGGGPPSAAGTRGAPDARHGGSHASGTGAGAGGPDESGPEGRGAGTAAGDCPGFIDAMDHSGLDPDVARRLLAAQRPRPQLLLHALLDCVRLASRTDTLPDNGGLRPQLFITMTLAELTAGSGSAAVPHTGPIPITAVRRAACDAGIIPAVLGADGEVLDVGRSQRLVTPAIRRALLVRDRGCAFPGCDRPVQWTDAHHIIPWSEGGDTSVENCVLLCTYHHHLVHHTGWEVEAVAGIPWFLPPLSIDPLRRPLRNTFHHAGAG
ncbi:HNH endonuclease signature motif containing protein [Arthrobacter sp. 35W]|uniref:HNH endonuclease signature motif containing protein n=1 Tax=Arthrobacter sp. 35W TaxID=1132441 RepID=UPI00041E8D2E|nr:HNH endonuclease signature motif containing protein [Arthrobacter sp. 35W]